VARKYIQVIARERAFDAASQKAEMLVIRFTEN
jgi:hypothetical protein